MDFKEIERYCLSGFGICVYRKRVKRAQFIIQNIIIKGDNDGRYSVRVEFDPMGMVDFGEGICWRSESYSLDEIIKSIEEFSGLSIEQWENYTKTGFKPFYNSEKVTYDNHKKSWEVLESKYNNGQLLLPKTLEFECKTILK